MIKNIKVAKLFNEIKDGDYGLNVAKKSGFGEHYTYVTLQYFEKIGLIIKERVKQKRRSKQFNFNKNHGHKKLIFLTEKGKNVQKLLIEGKLPENMKILSNMINGI